MDTPKVTSADSRTAPTVAPDATKEPSPAPFFTRAEFVTIRRCVGDYAGNENWARRTEWIEAARELVKKIDAGLTGDGNRSLPPVPMQQLIEKWTRYRDQPVRYFSAPRPGHEAFNDRVRLCEDRLIAMFISDLEAALRSLASQNSESPKSE